MVKNRLKRFSQLLSFMLIAVHSHGQRADIVAVYQSEEELVSFQLFEESGGTLSGVNDPFTARAIELAESYPLLTVSGDFTGDGHDEMACFGDLHYTPNMNPGFTKSVVWLLRSAGNIMVPAGTWFSIADSLLDLTLVDFTVAADYNHDGKDDIALFYNDPSSELQLIYVLESNDSGFSLLKTFYSTVRNEFNFTALRFACAGDFNGNGKTDIAAFYNYFGSAPETGQSIFLFESNGVSFTLLSGMYDGIKQDYNFSNMTFAQPGDYNSDGFTDIAVLNEDPLGQNHSIAVFEGSVTGELIPVDYFNTADSVLTFSNIKQLSGGEFAGDTAADLVLFYDNQGTGAQEILVLEGEPSGFKSPIRYFRAESGDLPFGMIKCVQAGDFIHQPRVIASTWKDDKQGAISFTFDDGYQGAFEHGAAALDDAGLTGTFYIFTDTVDIYDAPLAGTELIREFRNRGFEIGSHTTNHSNLGLLTENQDYETLNDVLANSVDLLNQRFDQETYSMSIPFGSFRMETLDVISNYFHTARSSQFGFNLPTPYDFFALKSWPILSSSTPQYVDGLVQTAETYGYYLPLMYHDILKEPFDEDSLIYSYSLDLFRETVQLVSQRNVWIDTHERIYKYIRERNALNISQLDTEEMESAEGHFSFVADDGLVDSVFNVELTLKIRIPDTWDGEVSTVGVGDSLQTISISSDENGNYILYDHIPNDQQVIEIYQGTGPTTGHMETENPRKNMSLMAYPNPFGNETFLRIKGSASKNISILIHDIHGRMVRDIRQLEEGSFRLERKNLPAGLYVVQLIDSGQPVSRFKLVAQ